jgi:anti-sigma B factor antagonist
MTDAFRPAPLLIETRLERGLAIAAVRGEFDIYARSEFNALVTNIQHTAPRPHLLLDLSEMGFADSTALGQFIAAAKRAAARGGRIALVGVPDAFEKVIRVTGLTGLLPAFESHAAARAYLEQIGEAAA